MNDNIISRLSALFDQHVADSVDEQTKILQAQKDDLTQERDKYKKERDYYNGLVIKINALINPSGNTYTEMLETINGKNQIDTHNTVYGEGKDKPQPEHPRLYRVVVDKDACICCGACESICNQVFVVEDTSLVNEDKVDENIDAVNEAVGACPVEALSIFDVTSMPGKQ